MCVSRETLRLKSVELKRFKDLIKAEKATERARVDAGISADPQLRSWLVQHQFDGILPGLVELGVRTMQDLCYIRDDEMCVSSLLPRPKSRFF